jgi:hypothetical protein
MIPLPADGQRVARQLSVSSSGSLHFLGQYRNADIASLDALHNAKLQV